MSITQNYITKLEVPIYHKIEEIAFKQPNAVRLLGIPLAIAIILKETLLIPIHFGESVAKLLKNVKLYLYESDQDEKLKKKELIIIDLFIAAILFLKIPFSPLIGILDAVSLVGYIELKPYAGAKLYASFIEKELIIRNPDIPIAKIARDIYQSAYNRFRIDVDSKGSNDEIVNLHFLDSEASKQQLSEEIMERCKIYHLARDKRDELLEQSSDSQEKTATITNAFKEFRTRLIETNIEQIKTLEFNPI